MSMRFLVAFLALLSAVAAGPSTALPVLDQEYDPSIDRLVAIGQVAGQADPDIDLSQTFTVGITGFLTSVEVLVGRESGTTNDLVLDIRTTAGGVPTEADSGANVLASASLPAVTLPPISNPQFVSVDFSSLGLSVTAGDVLSIVLQSVGDNPAYLWGGSSGDGYAGGEAYRRFLSLDPTWTPATSVAGDLAFRTFVVPEPSTGLLVMGGLVFLGTRRRRRLPSA